MALHTVRVRRGRASGDAAVARNRDDECMRTTLALTFVVAAVFAAPAVAGDIGVTLGFKAGALGVKTQNAALGGTTRVVVTVVDARGSGNGWSLRLEGAGAPTVTRISMRCASGSTCTLPNATPALPGVIGSTPTTVLSAARDSGMGAVELVLNVTGGRGRLAVTVAPH